jgi:ABC-type sugar transport system ATPase subunit
MELFGSPFKPADPHAAIAAGIGLVPQDRRHEGLLMSMSVKDNITLSRLPLISRFIVNIRAQRSAANRWIDYLRIRTASTSVRPLELSGGNQQKVAIARWLHAGARVMIFDEPGQAVDAGAKGEIFAAIRHLSADGCAVLVISDEIEELQQLVDRVLVMRAGRITGELKGEEITDERVLELAMKSAPPTKQSS